MAPVNIVVPEPENVRPPAPENTPDKVALPEVGLTMVPPALVTLKPIPERSPFCRINEPPANTGLTLVPTLLSPKLVPAVILGKVPEPVLDALTTKSQIVDDPLALTNNQV